MAGFRASAARLLLLVVSALFGACGRAPAPPAGVLLVSIDTLRGDHLGLYGYGRDTSPHLDALAGDGVVFDAMTSVCSWTLPSHATMLTGLYPAEHGLQDDGVRLAPGLRTLAGTFAEEGWHTFAVVAQIYVSREYGLDRDFADFDDSLLAGGSTNPVAAEVVDRFLERLDSAPSGRPWFAFLHLFDPHWDYTAPGAWGARWVDPGYRGPVDGTLASLGAWFAPGAPMPAADRDAMVARYDGEVGYVDEQLARLWRELTRRGLADRIAVAITSDHGEEFKEHGQLGHGRTLFGEQLRVPLLLWGAGVGPAGRRAEPVSTVDLAPTLLGLAGLPAPADWSGRDLLGEPGPADRVVLAESIRFGRELRSARDRDTKAIHSRHQDSWMYFDLLRDPAEQAPAGTLLGAAVLRTALEDYAARVDAGWHLKLIAPFEGRWRATFTVESEGRLVDPRRYFSAELTTSSARFDRFELAADGRRLDVDVVVSRHVGEIVFRTEPPDASITLRAGDKTAVYLGAGAEPAGDGALTPGDPRLAGTPRDYTAAPLGVHVRHVAAPTGDEVELTPEAQERLRALGYTD